MDIQQMGAQHAPAVMEMMREFYASPAVHSNGSPQIFLRDIEACLDEKAPLDGYVFFEEDALIGYAMTAPGFSTEYAQPCVWIEDLYLCPQARGHGLAGEFFAFLQKTFPAAQLRLEVEPDNESALRAYRKAGFSVMPYTEMKR